MTALGHKLVELTNNEKSFIATAEYLVQLSANANKIFESSQADKKNKILRVLLANAALNQKRLQLNLLQPFSGLSSDKKRLSWLSLQVTDLDTVAQPSLQASWFLWPGK